MKQKEKITVEDLRKKYPTAKVIRDWNELKEIPKESKTHILEVGEYNGSITSKDNGKQHYLYLSTHTFYGENFVDSTRMLQVSGFNVIIDNWDAE